MATGLSIDVTTGRGTEVEVPVRPLSPLRAQEHGRAMAVERLARIATRGDELGRVAEDFLIVMGYRDG